MLLVVWECFLLLSSLCFLLFNNALHHHHSVELVDWQTVSKGSRLPFFSCYLREGQHSMLLLFKVVGACWSGQRVGEMEK